MFIINLDNAEKKDQIWGVVKNASYLNNIKTVAGIKKISLQAMNFRIFCWLAVSLSRRFLINIKLLGPTD